MPLKPYRPNLEKSFHRSSMISNRTDSGFESDTSCCSGENTDENDIPGKEFIRTCNVLPFSCTHLSLWREVRKKG